MANVQIKSGGYTIPARKTQEFTFWWGDGYLPTAYFNVSIEPNAEGLDLIPLIEEGLPIRFTHTSTSASVFSSR